MEKDSQYLEAPLSRSRRSKLAAEDVGRLALFKWRYVLEAAGFTSPKLNI